MKMKFAFCWENGMWPRLTAWPTIAEIEFGKIVCGWSMSIISAKFYLIFTKKKNVEKGNIFIKKYI